MIGGLLTRLTHLLRRLIAPDRVTIDVAVTGTIPLTEQQGKKLNSKMEMKDLTNTVSGLFGTLFKESSSGEDELDRVINSTKTD